MPKDLHTLVLAIYLDDARPPPARLTTNQLVASLTVVDLLNDDLAAALMSALGPPVSPQRAATLLTALHTAGWLVATRAPGSARALRWVATACTVVRPAFREQHPNLANRLNEVAADWEATHGEPARALRHAVAAQSWSRVVIIVASHWPTLLFEQPATLARALKATPSSALVDSPVAAALSELVAKSAPGEAITRADLILPPLLTESELTTVARSGEAQAALDASLAAMVVLRRRGSFALAHAYSRQLSTLELPGPAKPNRPASRLAALALTQSAILAELSGESAEAIGTLREAYRTAPASQFSFSAAEIAARLAVSYSTLGLLRQATEWLGHLRDSPPPRGLLARSITGLGQLAEATIAVAQLDAARADQALTVLGTALDNDEYWPFVVAARVNYTLAWGNPPELVADLDAVRSRKATDAAGVIGPLLANAEANLLIALGRGNEAWSVLEGPHRRHPLLDEPRLRLALLIGDNHRARDLALTALDRPLVHSPTQRLEMALIMAIASYRLGRQVEAVDALRRAVHQANLLTMFQPFARLPRADLLAIAEQVPDAASLLARMDLIRASRRGEPKVRLVILGSREQLILDQLALGRAAMEIAATLNVSINTVRSQRRGLYRKLGAASRTQAIRIATDLGLVTHRANT